MWLMIILVPVLFGLIGFAVDLGILYSVKGELKTAANAMALAAAQRLIGTDASAPAASAEALLTVESSSGFGNRYYFHAVPIGQDSGGVVSELAAPAFYATAADAISSGVSPGSEVPSAQAKYVRVTVTGQTRLLFWSFLPIVSDRNLPVLATAVGGISAPLCQACGIEPFSVGAVDASELTDFGFLPGTVYSLYYLCTTGAGAVTPPMLAGATASAGYLLLNRFDANALVLPDESSQAFRDGAGGLPGNANSAQACFTVNNPETIWPSATVARCGATVAATVTAALCGLDARFETAAPSACANIGNIDTLSSIYQPDTDPASYDIYTDYAGNGRRIVTVPVVDALSGTAAMTPLGFRQFLLEPAQGATGLDPADSYGRFRAMYIGSVAPLKQGSFAGCTQAAGPGKVVLHQ